MVVVEHFDEGLDLGPLGNLLLAHGGGHLTGIAVDACHQSVAVGTVSGAIVNVLQKNGNFIYKSLSHNQLKQRLVHD